MGLLIFTAFGSRTMSLTESGKRGRSMNGRHWGNVGGLTLSRSAPEIRHPFSSRVSRRRTVHFDGQLSVLLVNLLAFKGKSGSIDGLPNVALEMFSVPALGCLEPVMLSLASFAKPVIRQLIILTSDHFIGKVSEGT